MSKRIQLHWTLRSLCWKKTKTYKRSKKDQSCCPTCTVSSLITARTYPQHKALRLNSQSMAACLIWLLRQGLTWRHSSSRPGCWKENIKMKKLLRRKVAIQWLRRKKKTKKCLYMRRLKVIQVNNRLKVWIQVKILLHNLQACLEIKKFFHSLNFKWLFARERPPKSLLPKRKNI